MYPILHLPSSLTVQSHIHSNLPSTYITTPSSTTLSFPFPSIPTNSQQSTLSSFPQQLPSTIPFTFHQIPFSSISTYIPCLHMYIPISRYPTPSHNNNNSPNTFTYTTSHSIINHIHVSIINSHPYHKFIQNIFHKESHSKIHGQCKSTSSIPFIHISITRIQSTNIHSLLTIFPP